MTWEIDRRYSLSATATVKIFAGIYCINLPDGRSIKHKVEHIRGRQRTIS